MTASARPGGDRPTATDAPGWTRFAPAPTGYLHLGHVANAIFVWGLARLTGYQVLLRIEDHDRQRSRAAFDAALLEDLEWLGFAADAGPVRQSDDDTPYTAALARLRELGVVYSCDCSRLTMTGWKGPGCAGRCATRGLSDSDGTTLRAALGGGDESWTDLIVGRATAPVAATGDLPIRDRLGNWTYGFSVVVDDHRQAVDLVVRGEDLRAATGDHIRLARLLGREQPPRFAHHPLIRKPGGAKLSKADGDTSVRDLRSGGATADELIGRAAAMVGLIDEPREVAAAEVGQLIR